MLTVLSRNLGPALGLLADVVCSPAFEEAEFERVRERRLHRHNEERAHARGHGAHKDQLIFESFGRHFVG